MPRFSPGIVKNPRNRGVGAELKSRMTRLASLLLATSLAAVPTVRAEEPKLDLEELKAKLTQLVLKSDKDKNGSLDLAEFRSMPLLRQVKKDKLDGLFAEVDADSNAMISSEELGKGLPKITELLVKERLGDDAKTGRDAKKIKRLLRP